MGAKAPNPCPKGIVKPPPPPAPPKPYRIVEGDVGELGIIKLMKKFFDEIIILPRAKQPPDIDGHERPPGVHRPAPTSAPPPPPHQEQRDCETSKEPYSERVERVIKEFISAQKDPDLGSCQRDGSQCIIKRGGKPLSENFMPSRGQPLNDGVIVSKGGHNSPPNTPPPSSGIGPTHNSNTVCKFFKSLSKEQKEELRKLLDEADKT